MNRFYSGLWSLAVIGCMHTAAVRSQASSAVAVLATAAAPQTTHADPILARSPIKVAVRSSDMKRSIHFYRDVLGLNLLSDMGDVENGLAVERALGIAPKDHGRIHPVVFGGEGSGGEGQKLGIAGGQGALIEVVEFTLPRKLKRLDSSSLPDIGGAFVIGFQVDDIEDTYSKLKAQHVEFISPPQIVDSSTVGTKVVKLCFFRDPDGTVLELIGH